MFSSEKEFIEERNRVYEECDTALDCLKELEAEEKRKEKDYQNNFQEFKASIEESHFLERFEAADERFQKAKQERIDFWKRCEIDYPVN